MRVGRAARAPVRVCVCGPSTAGGRCSRGIDGPCVRASRSSGAPPESSCPSSRFLDAAVATVIFFSGLRPRTLHSAEDTTSRPPQTEFSPYAATRGKRDPRSGRARHCPGVRPRPRVAPTAFASLGRSSRSAGTLVTRRTLRPPGHPWPFDPEPEKPVWTTAGSFGALRIGYKKTRCSFLAFRVDGEISKIILLRGLVGGVIVYYFLLYFRSSDGPGLE